MLQTNRKEVINISKLIAISILHSQLENQNDILQTFHECNLYSIKISNEICISCSIFRIVKISL